MKQKKLKKNIKVVLGDICYPKSEALIIPGNTKGITNRGILDKIVKYEWRVIRQQLKEITTKNKNIEIGDILTTDPGKFKRRGVIKVYHCIIKRLISDYTSLNIIENVVNKVFKQVIDDYINSVTICGIGIEKGDLDPRSVARITCGVCNKYKHYIKIMIIDDNIEFINECNKILENSN